MGKKMIGLIILTVFILSALFITPAGAASGWYTCSVISAGPGGSGYVYIMLTDTGTGKKFTKMWFIAPSGQENRQLATALAALANGKKVYVNVNPTVSTLTSRTITSIYMLNY